MSSTEAITQANYAERLAAVNASLRFTNIKGKEYAEVNQRILAFWSLFPNGRIECEILSDTGTRIDMEARTYRTEDAAHPATVAHAFEVKGGAINSTSYVENCETSAVGRALGLLGIGANTAVASAEEVLNAIAQQEAAQQPKRGRANTKPKPKQTAPQNAPQPASDPLRTRAANVVHAGGQGVQDSIIEQLHSLGVERIEQLQGAQRDSFEQWLGTVEFAVFGQEG